MVQRVGSRGAVADVARSLCAKLAPTLLAPANVAALAEAALAAAREDAGPDFVRAVLGLLVDAAAAAPTLFSGLLGLVRRSSRVLREPLPRMLAACEPLCGLTYVQCNAYLLVHRELFVWCTLPMLRQVGVRSQRDARSAA